MTYKTFTKFYGQVCSRCFGWGLPSTAMVPMADNFNHSDVSNVQEIIVKDMHLDIQEGHGYFTKTKMMNDYSEIFQEELQKLEGDDSAAAKL